MQYQKLSQSPRGSAGALLYARGVIDLTLEVHALYVYGDVAGHIMRLYTWVGTSNYRGIRLTVQLSKIV